MPKFVQFAFLCQQKGRRRLTVRHSLASSPLLEDINVIFGGVGENVAKTTVCSTKVDCNNHIPFGNICCRHVVFLKGSLTSDKIVLSSPVGRNETSNTYTIIFPHISVRTSVRTGRIKNVNMNKSSRNSIRLTEEFQGRLNILIFLELPHPFFLRNKQRSFK